MATQQIVTDEVEPVRSFSGDSWDIFLFPVDSFSGVRHASPASKANEDLANAKFYAEIAKAQNAVALGVKANTIVMLSS